LVPNILRVNVPEECTNSTMLMDTDTCVCSDNLGAVFDDSSEAYEEQHMVNALFDLFKVK